MEENKNTEAAQAGTQDNAGSRFSIADIYTMCVLNWQWFVLSLVICVGVAMAYFRYTTPVYKTTAKILIKDSDNRRRSTQNMYMTGLMSNSYGLENEIEIITSHSIAEQTVRDLKLYTEYYTDGNLKDVLMYKTQSVSVDMDPAHLEKLNIPVSLVVRKENGAYHVTGTYHVPLDENRSSGPYQIDKTLSKLPATIGTRAGILTFSPNSVNPMPEGSVMKVVLSAPKDAANKYMGALSVVQNNGMSSIAKMTITDVNPQRSSDYLRQIVQSYNRQANEDKNEIAMRTEEFINGRLEKINAELGNTEGQVENYKKRNRMVQLEMSGAQAAANADAFSQKLVEANTQMALLGEMSSYINNPANKYQPLPSNVGLSDASATSLIENYNAIVQKRNLLLQSASESSPSVMPLTNQLDDLQGSIRRALTQARRNMDIQRNSVASQFGKYQGQVGQSPEQERMLTQIGRQQEVKSGLYLMLLQKREENSISLAATVDKGKLIDRPSIEGRVSPDKKSIILGAVIAGLGIPAALLFIISLFHYKIEGHDDVERLTKLPIIGDVAVASDTAKTKADIVVHENKNNMMEEIFRLMRTNIQFMLKEQQKVIMCTSTTFGEGKTFVTSNLAVSFALLGKKVLLVGLDIRKPRLAELFELDDHRHGITNLLVKDSPDWETIERQIVPSCVNNNLDLLLAGPIPPNPAELVARNSLGEIFRQLRDHYDYILVDTAPVGLVSDTLQIGSVCDMTLYMCRADYTPKDCFDLVNELSVSEQLPTMAVVINGIDMSKKKNGYYYGYGRYGKYGKYGRYGRSYGKYGRYGAYGSYSQSQYGDKNDDSVKQ